MFTVSNSVYKREAIAIVKTICSGNGFHKTEVCQMLLIKRKLANLQVVFTTKSGRRKQKAAQGDQSEFLWSPIVHLAPTYIFEKMHINNSG